MPPARGDRRARLAQVGDVVQRVVEPEDLDAVLRGAGDEAADDVPADRARSDEEAAAQRDSERCRDAGLDRPDPLPRALDPPAHGRVEDAAARDLEAREARSVEDLGHPQDLRGRNPPGQGLLREQPDRRVDELRHRPDLSDLSEGRTPRFGVRHRSVNRCANRVAHARRRAAPIRGARRRPTNRVAPRRRQSWRSQARRCSGLRADRP